jgi:predicted Fe-Mo cluster-binding NifX family protein
MNMLFAVPTINEKLCAHFGHCEKFAILETSDNKIRNVEYLNPPVHQPGTYPKFLAEQGVHVIISGGMGMKAQELFKQQNIEVFLGINAEDPRKLVEHYLHNQLESGQNLCDH